MHRARFLLLMGTTLGAASLLMEWATYANSAGDHVFFFVVPVSLDGTDYAQWPYVLGATALVGLSAFAAPFAPRVVTFGAAVIGSLALVLVGVWLYVEPVDRAYERAFLVVANNVADALGHPEDVSVEEIRDIERDLAIDRQEEIRRIRLSPGRHAPLAAGVLSLIGAVALWSWGSSTLTGADRDETARACRPAYGLSVWGAVLAGLSCLMVWGHYQATWPSQSSFILFDHPTFTGVDFAQWPFVFVLSLVAAVSALVCARNDRRIPLWFLRGSALCLIALGVSIFFTGASDSFDETLAPPLGGAEAVSLRSLAEFTGQTGGENVFTDKGRFQFDVGGLGPAGGGLVVLIGTLITVVRRPHGSRARPERFPLRSR